MFVKKAYLGACLKASPYVIIQKLQIKHAGGFWKWCQSGLFGSVRPAEEINQKGEKT